MVKKLALEKTPSPAKAFYSVVAGHNYSHELGRYMDISQPTALELLRKLVGKKLIMPGKLEGRLLRYSPNWKYISDSWIKFLWDKYYTEVEVASKISFGTVRRNEKTNQIEHVSAETYSVEQKKKIRIELENLKGNPKFIEFVKLYFISLGELEHYALIPEAFMLFAYEVRAERLMKYCDFVGLLQPRSSVLGIRVSTKLETELIESHIKA